MAATLVRTDTDTNTNTGRLSQKLVPELDGVRGIAILLVLLADFNQSRPCRRSFKRL